MYYLVYGILYLFSLLPFFVLYRLSELAFLILYYIAGYRKQVVMDNLRIVFPNKPEKELKKIARKFYLNLTDSFIETIKMLSMSNRQFERYISIDLTAVNRLAAEGKSIQFQLGHQFNWEYGNWITARHIRIPWIGIYMRISNPALDKIFYNLRSKQGTILIAAQDFKKEANDVLKGQYAIGLVADQNPGVAWLSYWLYFFGKPTCFVSGPDKSAIRLNKAVVFITIERLKRGRYRVVPEVFTEDAGKCSKGEITRHYRDYLEERIRRQPDNYLWSHRRWKHQYEAQYAENLWIDTAPPPELN